VCGKAYPLLEEPSTVLPVGGELFMDLSLWKIPEFAGEEESCIGVRAAGGLGERSRPGSPPGLGTESDLWLVQSLPDLTPLENNDRLLEGTPILALALDPENNPG
jgi:hypothetical protein